MRTQRDAIVETMAQNGGYATLKYLYDNALNIPGVEWKTRTPFASMRRIVQKSPLFFRVKPGLWALAAYRQRLPSDIAGLIDSPGTPPDRQARAGHYYYQGLLVELGNLNDYTTYVPAQDKNRPFLQKKLADVAATTTMPVFTYQRIVSRVKSIDVVWFNRRGLPHAVYEVEYSTDFTNSLLKFHELVDFSTKMAVVAAGARRDQFRDIVARDAFSAIRSRVEFVSFDRLAGLHTRTSELRAAEARIDG